MAKYNRRSTRPLLDLPSLFSPENENEVVRKAVIEMGLHRRESTKPDEEFIVDAKYAQPLRRLRFISFGSGSSGNCAYVGTSDCGLLVDAGVDNNRVTEQLRVNGIDIATINGILLTHDHADHVRYAYALLRRNQHMRLYCTMRVLDGILRRHNVSRRIKDYHSPIFKEHEYHFGDISVVPFETSHDGSDNMGFSFTMDNTVLVIATDMGVITPRADHYMRQANALVIESNYDDSMLEDGPYPVYLKARIRSATGHMNNAETARYLSEIYTPALRHVMLCHLSHDNNTPQTALAATTTALEQRGAKLAPSSAEIATGSVWISALPRYDSSELFVF